MNCAYMNKIRIRYWNINEFEFLSQNTAVLSNTMIRCRLLKYSQAECLGTNLKMAKIASKENLTQKFAYIMRQNLRTVERDSYLKKYFGWKTSWQNTLQINKITVSFRLCKPYRLVFLWAFVIANAQKMLLLNACLQKKVPLLIVLSNKLGKYS